MGCLGLRTTARFNPKILGLNDGILRTVSDSPELGSWDGFGQSGIELSYCFQAVGN